MNRARRRRPICSSVYDDDWLRSSKRCPCDWLARLQQASAELSTTKKRKKDSSSSVEAYRLVLVDSLEAATFRLCDHKPPDNSVLEDIRSTLTGWQAAGHCHL